MQLGRLGVWTTYRAIGAHHAGESAKLVEDLGFGTFWLGGSPHLPDLRPLLEASSSLVAASAIANVWQYEPETLAADHAQLSAEFPGRVMAGIGIGHPEATTDYARPLSTIRSFLDRLDAAEHPVPRDERCLAALRPKMLRLSAERTRGALSYFVPVEHTRFARDQLGDALLAVELACVVEEDVSRARAAARDYAKTYLRLRNYAGNLTRFGFSEEDFANGGSDRLIDAVIPHGSFAEIAGVVRQHFDAGADHVCVQPLGMSGVPRESWSVLAAELIE
jgi:probable F420-dependent oxidoreductase